MGKNKFLEYINNSEFDRALENLSKKDFDDNEIKLNTALLKRYQGKLTESITILEELFKFKSVTITIILLCRGKKSKSYHD